MPAAAVVVVVVVVVAAAPGAESGEGPGEQAGEVLQPLRHLENTLSVRIGWAD